MIHRNKSYVNVASLSRSQNLLLYCTGPSSCDGGTSLPLRDEGKYGGRCRSCDLVWATAELQMTYQKEDLGFRAMADSM